MSASCPAGSIGVLFLGLPGPPTFVPLFLDAIVMQAGTENAQVAGTLGTPLSAGYTVPPLPLLRGTRVTWQGVSADATNGLQLSNSVTYVHW